ncbi:hypothetical protein C8255_15865 [filamentous cyanobacterium CCP3]|nr:hypothetical protein C8255_15865 [filamentous cyanobacterium CCP3]
MVNELRLLVENAVFFVIATAFLAITGWAWRYVDPFDLPKPLPGWFKYWFGSVQVLGIVPPLIALVWAIWRSEPAVWMVFAAYFALLGLQILSELLTLKQLHSVVWVMVPYLYVPYRLWQLYEGIELTAGRPGLAWIQLILAAEIVVWGINYLLDLAQLPRLFRWQ